MPGSGSNVGPFPDLGNGGASGDDHFRLVRYTHIFASAVREVLELKLLRETSPLPLTLSQLHLLKLMTYDGPHLVHDVADFLGVSAPAATRNVDKLERLGLIIRKPSKGDRRATLLTVSEKGRRLVERYEEIKTARLEPVLGSFHPEEIEQLSSLLERFAVSLLQLEGVQREFCLRCDAYIDSGCSVGEIRGGCPYEKAKEARMGLGGS